MKTEERMAADLAETGKASTLVTATLTRGASSRTIAEWWVAAHPTIQLTVQLTLLGIAIQLFNIESTAFLHVCVLAFAGAVVHGVLPMERRLSFFALLSLTGIVLVFGVSQGLWLLALGLVLIGLCHLPISFRARVGLLVAAGAGIAALRLDLVSGPWSRAIWPILGSMFMFRLIVYMYDLRHEKEPRSLARILAYFFLLPNVCFPMFPVVDYKTFKRTYYAEEGARIQQVGVEWIIRGVFQLILYRFVYYYLVMSPDDVTNPADLGRFMVANYLLYLRISGQFHVIVGILRLFGFGLPETHHRYLLASSINDFWRRINIYWKDFMMKLFYYPSFFALRKRGVTDRSALVLATLVVFISTWLLHSYQWFWLRGTFPLTWPDALFWGILGLLVVGNTLYEADKGRTRRLGNRALTASEVGGKVLSTALTLGFICILWSLWTAESVTNWLALWGAAFSQGVSARTWEALSIGAIAVVLGSSSNPTPPRPPKGGAAPSLLRRSLVSTACVAILCIAGYPPIYSRLDARVAGVIESLREQKLNAQDAAMLERGYYENLLSVERFNSQLWELYSKRPANWGNLRDAGGMRPTDGFLVEELIPSIDIPFKGTPVRTNRWGMRDVDYPHEKPDGTRRIALFGPSDTLGAGVEMERTFATVLEGHLNAAGDGARYEVLNFGTSNYTPPQHLYLFEERALAFDPDVIILVGHDDDAQRAVRHVAAAVSRNIAVPYEPLRAFAERAGVVPGMHEDEIRRRLRPATDEILAWTYGRMGEICRQRGIRPIWVFLPFLVEDVEHADQTLLNHARTAGFEILDLSTLYAGRDIASMRIADWDHHHPNVEGHAMIAERLFKVLQASPATAHP